MHVSLYKILFSNRRDIWAGIHQASQSLAASENSNYDIVMHLFLAQPTWWTPALEVKRIVWIEHCWMCDAEAACDFFCVCAERETGGWRAPWPAVRAATSPAIMWLRPTPSRQKSKVPPLFLSCSCRLKLICLLSRVLANEWSDSDFCFISV